MNIFFELHKDLPREGPGDPETTEKAFRMIPSLPVKPAILDVGCGPGMQTLQLAQLSGGDVTAIDTHQPFLDHLQNEAEKQGLTERVHPLHMSMSELKFQPKQFDLIWSEGAIYIMGFQHGLESWRPYLKTGGFVAVSELSWIKDNPPQALRDYWLKEYPAMQTNQANLALIEKAGYKLIDHFFLSRDAWWNLYYAPLEKRITMLKEKYAGDEEALQILADNREEIDIFRKYFGWYSYAFYVMQKAG